MIDRTLKHNRVTAALGAGGMGEVYLAEGTNLDRNVALKILLADVVSNRERMERFVREANRCPESNGCLHHGILGLSPDSRATQPPSCGLVSSPGFHHAYHRRDYRGELEIALKINMPGYCFTHAALAAVYGQLGELERARAALRELHALAPISAPWRARSTASV